MQLNPRTRKRRTRRRKTLVWMHPFDIYVPWSSIMSHKASYHFVFLWVSCGISDLYNVVKCLMERRSTITHASVYSSSLTYTQIIKGYLNMLEQAHWLPAFRYSVVPESCSCKLASRKALCNCLCYPIKTISSDRSLRSIVVESKLVGKHHITRILQLSNEHWFS